MDFSRIAPRVSYEDIVDMGDHGEACPLDRTGASPRFESTRREIDVVEF